MSQPAAVCSIYALAPLGGVVMAMLAAINLVELACEVGAIYFVVVASCMTCAIYACGVSLIRAIDGSLATRQAQAVPRMQGMGNTNTRDGQDLRLLTTRKNIKLAIGLVAVLMLTTMTLVLFGSVTPYGAAGPILFFVTPLDVLPTVWYEMNLWLHSPKRIQANTIARDMASSIQLDHISHPWSARVSGLAIVAMDEVKRRCGHASGRENEKGGVVVPTEETAAHPVVVVGSDA